MADTKEYQEESHPVLSNGKTVTIRNLTPVNTVHGKQKMRMEISKTLYGVF